MPIKMTPERIAQIQAGLTTSPQKPIQDIFSSLKSKVNVELEDKIELSYCGGITIIHTPGHICLYLSKYRTLIAGDALNIIDNKLVGHNSQFAFDKDLAANSLKKLTEYDIETVICYHGGVYSKNINQRINEIISGR